MNFRVNRQKM